MTLKLTGIILSISMAAGLSVLFVNCQNQSSMKQEFSVVKKSADLLNKDGEKIIIEGVYSLYYPFPNQKGKNDEYIIQVKLEGDEGPFLEPYWDKKSKRTTEEVNRFKNRKVQVLGVYHKEQPIQPGAPEDASSFGGSCISPVDTISLIE